MAERQWICNQLAGVADFWLRSGMDEEQGGVYPCPDRAGQLYMNLLCRMYCHRNRKSCEENMQRIAAVLSDIHI